MLEMGVSAHRTPMSCTLQRWALWKRAKEKGFVKKITDGHFFHKQVEQSAELN